MTLGPLRDVQSSGPRQSGYGWEDLLVCGHAVLYEGKGRRQRRCPECRPDDVADEQGDLFEQTDLFPDLPALPPAPPPIVDTRSAGVRLTDRQRALVAAGVHPLTRERTRPDLGTCGDCALRVLVLGHTRTYPKCVRGLPDGRPLTDAPYASRGAATDVRAWWPACPSHELAHTGTDAARWTPDPEDTP